MILFSLLFTNRLIAMRCKHVEALRLAFLPAPFHPIHAVTSAELAENGTAGVAHLALFGYEVLLAKSMCERVKCWRKEQRKTSHSSVQIIMIIFESKKKN